MAVDLAEVAVLEVFRVVAALLAVAVLAVVGNFLPDLSNLP